MKPLVIAHRGACRQHPANSVAAFQAAVDMGADMIELDVRRTLDGVLVVQHDLRHRGLPISRWLYADLVKAPHRRVRRRGRLVGGTPPTLQETLELCAGKIRLDVELKDIGHEKEVLDLLLDHLSPQDFVVTSFLDESVARVKRLRPEVRSGLLLSSSAKTPREQLTEKALQQRLSQCGADFVAPYHLLVTERFLAKSEALSLPLVLWTVNRPKRLSRFLADPRVAGVITDVPDLALELRGAEAKPSSPLWG